MNIHPSELAGRARTLMGMLSPCRLCPNACAVDRRSGEFGRCGVGVSARVAGFASHFGEERALVGRHGSGTVFFSGCNLACLFCQNWRISQQREGTDVSDRDLADTFLRVQEMGCHNLNLVTPTPHAASIVRALAIAADEGFALPIVWNCGGYESVEVLRCLDGVVDVYMPDLKYGDETVATRLSDVRDYVARSRAAVREMHRQVGDLTVDGDGNVRRGLLVRHLVLPGGLAGTKSVMRFLAEAISLDSYVNVMDQYEPSHRSGEVLALRRRITKAERDEAIELAKGAGLRRFESCERLGQSALQSGNRGRRDKTMPDHQRLEATVHGFVQGVFFRHNTRAEAVRLDLTGTVWNAPDGTVRVVAEGPRERLDCLLTWLQRGPELAEVDRVDVEWNEAGGTSHDFRIVR